MERDVRSMTLLELETEITEATIDEKLSLLLVRQVAKAPDRLEEARWLAINLRVIQSRKEEN